MKDHTVAVDRSQTPTSLEFAPVFNTVVALIDRHLEEGRGDKIVIRTESGETVTYAQLAERSRRAGNVLKGLGARPGDRMLMILKDCPEFFYLFWGAVRAGIVAVPLNTMLRTADYTYMIEDSGCALLAYSPEFAAEVEPALDAASHKPVALKIEAGDLADRMAGESDALAVTPAGPLDDCFWLYSSGSTGRPKGTVHAQRDIIVNAEHYAVGVLDMGEDDVTFSAAKLFFAYGFGNSMNFVLWTGAATVLSDRRPTPDMTFEIIAAHRPNIYFGVPTLYAAQLQAMESQSPDLSSLRLSISAGEALPADLLRRWLDKVGQPIIDGIGSTEATHIFISNRPDDFRPGTSGRVMAGYAARIIDEAGNDVAQGEVGRLLVQGGSVATHYWNKPDKTAETMLGDDWLNTGDTYTRDSDGYYVYCGRSDDMIKVGGIWCSPIEIEARLIEHAKVLEAAIVGRPDKDGLIKPEAHIILNDAGDAGDALAQELLEHCKDGLARYKYPRWFNFVDSLPKTATGKIQRFKLRAE